MTDDTGAVVNNPATALEDKLRHLSKFLGQVKGRLDDANARDAFLQGISGIDLPAMLADLRENGAPEMDAALRSQIPQIYSDLTQLLMQAEARGALLDDFTAHLQKEMMR